MPAQNFIRHLKNLPAFSPIRTLAGNGLGIYHAKSDILIGATELRDLGSNAPPVPYASLKQVELLGTKDEVQGLEIELLSGEKVRFYGFATNGKFNDVFTFMRFLNAAAKFARRQDLPKSENSLYVQEKRVICS